VHRAYHHNEDKADVFNDDLYADNEYTGTKSDIVATTEEVTNEKNEKLSPFDYDTFINVIMRPMIQEHEGITDYPYLDSKDNITIAVGANIQNNPWAIQWYLRHDESGKLTKLDNKNPQHKKIILEELAKLDKYKGENMKTEAFESKTNLRMSAQDVNKEYQRRMNIAIDDVKAIIKDFNSSSQNRNKIEDFEKMPLPLQKVLIDMAFNLGRNGFNWKATDQKTTVKGKTVTKKVGYPNFWKALAAHRLDKMIDEVARNKNLESFKKRNGKMKELLRKLENLENSLK